jgi:mRNA interferase RelE/StbE
MKYSLIVSKIAKRQLKRLDAPVQRRVLAAIGELAESPRPAGYRKLQARPGYRIRIGDYRVVYDIYDTIITVEIIEVGHRKDIYR